MLTDSELADLFDELESDRVERKQSLNQTDRIHQAICAFANDFPDRKRPGVIFLGVNDDGSCSNLQITDQILLKLADMRSDGNTLPFPMVTVEKRKIRECEVGVVVVEPSTDPPVRYRGRTWIRVGPSLRQATAAEESRLAEKRRAWDLPFDHRPVRGSSLADLDLEFFGETYVQSAIAREVLEQNERTLEQQLTSLRFLSVDGIPNVAAMLIFGKDPGQWVPGAYVQFLRIAGTELTDPIVNQKAVTGSLPTQLRQLDEILAANISTYTSITRSVIEIAEPDYPMLALQQLTRNAIMHRVYDNTSSPVRLYWFTDRIEIHSPGGLYGQVTRENFGKGATDYRNPLVAEAMKVLGYVQRFGMGLPLTKSELEKNGNPEAQFGFQANFVLATLFKRP